MNYLDDLYNAKELYNATHKNKANETILGVDCYRFVKNRVKHMSNWQPVFDDRGILREILGMIIKIDYFRPNLIEIRHNPYLKSSIDFIWLSDEEMKNMKSKESPIDVIFTINFNNIDGPTFILNKGSR